MNKIQICQKILNYFNQIPYGVWNEKLYTKNELTDDSTVKPADIVKIGDEITIEFGNKSVTVKVASLEVSTKKADAVNMYEFISDVPKEFTE